MNETPLVFTSQNKRLVGIIHQPEEAFTQGLLLIVGGPQTRVGSHRQFLLLARSLAKKGIAVFRFDYQGMGDSEGELSDFYSVLPDVDNALKVFVQQCPTLERVALWGLCDAASVAMVYAAYSPPIVDQLILLNPWVRQTQSKAQAVLKHYYLKKIMSSQFWWSLFCGKLNVVSSIKDVLGQFKKAYFSGCSSQLQVEQKKSMRQLPQLTEDNYISYMQQGLEAFNGNVSLIMSGEDLTAKEFEQLISKDDKWKQCMKDKCSARLDVADANHTFSTKAWRTEVERFTLQVLITHGN
ncbi:hydrolase 1, exosortase A system-associated [Candidatus Colwellia aromaticivorans]|uniref:hydrolase 1, exosortase A system-associated n=1 Tax=Candidatus Colwellia aromaticivorans TaxID=2267621 RepID=UPI0014444BB0|nr:hydrolase 1, exosortase A system-associated [Candidatus Colwellia aromaticivorans]